MVLELFRAPGNSTQCFSLMSVSLLEQPEEPRRTGKTFFLSDRVKVPKLRKNLNRKCLHTLPFIEVLFPLSLYSSPISYPGNHPVHQFFSKLWGSKTTWGAFYNTHL